MAALLLVPIRLDALVAERDQAVVAPSADFQLLPYTDGQQDVNGDRAPISETIINTPFSNQNLHLKRGIHLHWALPDALTRGRTDHQRTTFPTVPNRWLVLRSGSATSKSWLIESDYLYPDGQGADQGAVCVPFTPKPAQRAFRPFRFLGRAMLLGQWPGESTAAERVDRLTAVGFEQADGTGYGDPTFAAFYPNSRSCFGLYDADITGPPPTTLRYDLFGWYSRVEQDPLADLRRAMQAGRAVGAAAPTNDELCAALAERFQWQLKLANGQSFPNATVYHARLMFDAPVLRTGAPTSVTVGNTGVEALSARLAQRLDPQRADLIEDQLEALHLATRLEHRSVDIGAKFVEARHERGFTAVPGGSLWTVRLQSTANASADADVAEAREQIDLTDRRAGELLMLLNQLQQQFDRAVLAGHTLRRQVFADWHKYCVCAYQAEDSRGRFPDIDQVRHFIQSKGIVELRQLNAATFGLQQDTIEAHILAARTALEARLATLSAETGLPAEQKRFARAQATYVLKQIPAPRYWYPNEPVVLLTGPDVEPTPRHGQDGLLGCQLAPFDSVEALLAQARQAPAQLLATLNPPLSATGLGLNRWSAPWHPILLEWEVEIFPLRSQGNAALQATRYSPEFVAANYQLPADQPDFELRPGQEALTNTANIYRGSSILTPHAADLLEGRLAAYLRSELLDAYYSARQVPANQRDDAALDSQIADIESWYREANSATLATREQEARDPLLTAIRAYRALASTDCLSQTLSGFNEALLMHRQVPQFAIADPLGFGPAQEFSAAVQAIVGNHNRSAPDPHSVFSPIRCGAMKLLRLRLIDTFGQVRPIELNRVTSADCLRFPAVPGMVGLPPRLVQPARLNFRLLSAWHSDQEMVDHPDTAPICGWLLPNHLDASLMIFAPDGTALGSIATGRGWQPAPGALPIIPAQIKPGYLQQLVNYLLAQDPAFLPSFLATLEAALDRIEPENAAQHPELALLVGQPVALVRASLDLQLRGEPAVNQSWASFQDDLGRNFRDTDNFPQVRFPIRLGDSRQLGDGLVGYWLEDEAGYHGGFCAVQAGGAAHPQIRTASAHSPLQLFQGLDDPPQCVSMLVDPRASIHATSGIQPVKAIRIPPEQYLAALRAIEVTFVTAPILSGMASVELPLPSEPGFVWSWVEHVPDGWATLTAAPSITRTTFSTRLAEQLWDYLLDPQVGWLRQRPGLPIVYGAPEAELRVRTSLAAPFSAFQSRLEHLLATPEMHGKPITPAAFVTQVAATIGVAAWNQLCDQTTGWLQPLAVAPARAAVVPKDIRKLAQLSGDLAGTESLITQIFDLYQEQLAQASPKAALGSQQQLRDGWLKLSPEGG